MRSLQPSRSETASGDGSPGILTVADPTIARDKIVLAAGREIKKHHSRWLSIGERSKSRKKQNGLANVHRCLEVETVRNRTRLPDLAIERL